jgi:hypothetical protein
MAASILQLNPNRHRACGKAHQECEYKPGGEQHASQANQQQKPKSYEMKTKE